MIRGAKRARMQSWKPQPPKGGGGFFYRYRHCAGDWPAMGPAMLRGANFSGRPMTIARLLDPTTGIIVQSGAARA
jgi:hypothetical protein